MKKIKSIKLLENEKLNFAILGCERVYIMLELLKINFQIYLLPR